MKIIPRKRIKKAYNLFFIRPNVITIDKKTEYKQKVLFVVYCLENTTNTIRETVFEVAESSKYQIDILNLDLYGYQIPRNIKLSNYDAIILHNTVTYDARYFKYIDNWCAEKLDNFSGVKIIMKQDEGNHTKALIDYLTKHNFNALFTIWDEKTARKIYNPQKIKNLRIEQYLTGYVSDDLRKLYKQSHKENRYIDVGYRGSVKTLLYGKLAYEKREIGDKFIKFADKYNLITDISSNSADIFYGKQWFDFLLNCKGTLGVESGMSIVDMDGQAEKDLKRYVKKNPLASDEDILNNCLAKYEKGVQYRAISPRHLEAAACMTTQIMYEGTYQGIFIPDKHYIALKRDWSNIEEVIDKFKDPVIRTRINECAYEEIIMNPIYHFKNFVDRLDRVLDECFSNQS